MERINIAEKVLLEKFRIEPFHNFHRLNETSKFSSCIGGTCSGKTQSYVDALNKKGIKAYLHTAIIDNKFNHQLARIEFKENSYFADVGNGWPSLYLYPVNKEVNYTCYGMNFRSEIHNKTVRIFHTRLDEEKLQMEFNLTPQSQESVRENIRNRFTSNKIYPFDRGLRFSMIVDDSFLFLRNNEIQFYNDKEYYILNGVTPDNLAEVVKKHFNFDLTDNHNFK